MKLRLTPATTAWLLATVLCAGSCAPRPAESVKVTSVTPTPTPDSPQRRAALDEGITQDFDDPDHRLAARDAAAAYVRKHFPTWDVKGVSALAYTGNCYITGVDVSASTERKTVTLVVRLFVTDRGDTYWKAEPLTPELSHALAGSVWQRFQKLKKDHEELKESEAALQNNLRGQINPQSRSVSIRATNVARQREKRGGYQPPRLTFHRHRQWRPSPSRTPP